VDGAAVTGIVAYAAALWLSLAGARPVQPLSTLTPLGFILLAALTLVLLPQAYAYTKHRLYKQRPAD
jgi:hypothetical protein